MGTKNLINKGQQNYKEFVELFNNLSVLGAMKRANAMSLNYNFDSSDPKVIDINFKSINATIYESNNTSHIGESYEVYNDEGWPIAVVNDKTKHIDFLLLDEDEKFKMKCKNQYIEVRGMFLGLRPEEAKMLADKMELQYEYYLKHNLIQLFYKNISIAISVPTETDKNTISTQYSCYDDNEYWVGHQVFDPKDYFIISPNNSHDKSLVEKINLIAFDANYMKDFHAIIHFLIARYIDEVKKLLPKIRERETLFGLGNIKPYITDILTHIYDDEDLKTIIHYCRFK